MGEVCRKQKMENRKKLLPGLRVGVVAGQKGSRLKMEDRSEISPSWLRVGTWGGVIESRT